jgi:hypothetical protein
MFDAKTNWSLDESVMPEDMNRIEGGIGNIDTDLDSGAVAAPTISFGVNTVNYTGKVPVIPEISFKGATIINLLGKDGDCEDVSKWSDWQITHAVDATNKVFGSNGMKITLGAFTTGAMTKTVSSTPIDITKYYLISAYVKNGNATSIYLAKNNSGGGTSISTAQIVDSTKFTRVGIKVRPSDFASTNLIGVYIIGTSGQYVFCDGIMANEITMDEYNSLTETQLMAKYPYVESVQFLTNPYFENRRYNLVQNGNC